MVTAQQHRRHLQLVPNVAPSRHLCLASVVFLLAEAGPASQRGRFWHASCPTPLIPTHHLTQQLLESRASARSKNGNVVLYTRLVVPSSPSAAARE